MKAMIIGKIDKGTALMQLTNEGRNIFSSQSQSFIVTLYIRHMICIPPTYLFAYFEYLSVFL